MSRDTKHYNLQAIIAVGFKVNNPRAVQLLAFLQATQPEAVETLELAAEGIKRTQFLHRVQSEIAKRDVVDVLRNGVSHGPARLDLYKFLPMAWGSVT